MNNLKEKLELSQWLHEKGFEPDMWFDHDKTNGALFICPEYVKDEFENPSSANLSPWISLTRALELLRIHDAVEKYPNIHKEFLGILVQDDIHLAALRLLKQICRIIRTVQKEVNDE